MTEEVFPVVAADAEEGEQAYLEEPLTGEVLPALGYDAEEGGIYLRVPGVFLGTETSPEQSRDFFIPLWQGRDHIPGFSVGFPLVMNVKIVVLLYQ